MEIKIYGNYGNFFPFFFRILFRIANPVELGALIFQKMITENRPQWSISRSKSDSKNKYAEGVRPNFGAKRD